MGRTRPHQGGDKRPRWDEPPFAVDPGRGPLRFRVLIASSSVMGSAEVLCGEGACCEGCARLAGSMAVQDLLRQPLGSRWRATPTKGLMHSRQQPVMLPLHKGGP